MRGKMLLTALLAFLLASGTASAWFSVSYPTKQLMYVNGNYQSTIPYVINSTCLYLNGTTCQTMWAIAGNNSYLYSNGASSYAFVDSTETTQQNMTNESASVASYGTVWGNTSARYGMNGDFLDSSGNGNTGTITGATFNSSGKFTGAYRFDGNDYVQIPNSASLNATTGITISAWIYPMSSLPVTGTPVIVSKPTPTVADPYHMYALQQTGSTVKLVLAIGGTIKESGSPATNLNAGQWNYVVATYNGTHMNVYINGVNVKITAQTGNIDTNTQPVYLGKYYNGGGAGNDFLNAVLDEVHIYNRALSPSEITAEYNVGNVSTLGNYASTWDFYVQNSETSAFAQNFTLTLNNGTSNIIKTTQTYNVTDWMMSPTIPTGTVNITVDSIGLAETTFTRQINTTSSANFTLSVQPAGITLYVYDEATQTKPTEPILATITNGVNTTYFSIGSNYINGTGSYGNACDRSTSTQANMILDNGVNCRFALPIANITFNVQAYYPSYDDNSYQAVRMYGYNTDGTVNIIGTAVFDYSTVGACRNQPTCTRTIMLSNTAGVYSNILNFTVTSRNGSGNWRVNEIYHTLDSPASISYGSYPLGLDTITISDPATSTYHSRNYYLTMTSSTSTTLNAYLLKNTQGTNINFIVLNALSQALESALVTAQKNGATVQERYTDSSGVAQLFLDPAASYTITTSAIGYVTQSKTITPTTTPYYMWLSTSTAVNNTYQYSDITLTIEPTQTSMLQSQAQRINFSISSQDNAFTFWGWNISYPNTTALYAFNSTTNGGGNDYTIINTSTYLGDLYVFTTFTKNGNTTVLAKRYVVVNYMTGGNTLVDIFDTMKSTGYGFDNTTLSLLGLIFTATVMGFVSRYTLRGAGVVGIMVMAFLGFAGVMSWYIIMATAIVLAAVMLLIGGV